MAAFKDRVFDVVRRIPPGQVATYGDVAKRAGSPRAARHVGMVMRLSTADVPWWRVVGREGRIAIMRPDLHAEQRERLADERVRFDDEGRVDMARHAWRDP